MLGYHTSQLFKASHRIQKCFIRISKTVRRSTDPVPLFVQLKVLRFRYKFDYKVFLLIYKISGNLGVTIDRLTCRPRTRYADMLKLPSAT